MAGETPTKVWNRHFVHILLIEWCLQFGTYTTSPIASNYAVSLGAAIGVAGLIAGLNSTASLCMRPFTGWISDKFAKKSLIIASGACFTLAGFGCALAPTLEIMAAFRAVQGIGFALKSVILVGFVAFIVPKDKVGSAVGCFTIASTVASAIAPTIGQAVGTAVGYSGSFFVAGFFFLCGLALILTLKTPQDVLDAEKEREERRAAMTPEERKFKFNIKDFVYLPAFIPSTLGGLTSFCFSIISTFLIMTSTERGIEGATIFFLMYSACAFFSKPASGTLLDKKGFAPVFLPSLIIMVIAPAILVFADNIIWIAIAGLIFGVGHASAYACANAFSVKMSTPETSGRVVNTFYIVPDIGMGIGPLVGGLVYQLAGASAMYIFVVGIGLFDFALGLFLKARKVI